MNRRLIGTAALLSGFLVSGCTSAIDAPEDLRDSSEISTKPAAAPKPSRELALSLPEPSAGPPELDIWEKGFRVEGRRLKVVNSIDMTPLGGKDRPGRQADGIRDAARRSACLLVLPGPGIQEAIEEAAGLGAPILAIDTPLSAAGKPLPIVTFPPVEEGARALVKVAMAASKATGFPANGPALVVHRAMKDKRSDARADALEAALREAKVDLLPRLVYEGIQFEAKKELLPVLKDQPRLAMAFTTDEAALPVLVEQRRFRATPDRFSIAGYTSDRKELTNVTLGQVAALIDLNAGGMIPIAVRTAIQLSEGKPIPDRTIVPQPMYTALGEDLTDQLPKVPTIPTERPVPVKRDFKQMLMQGSYGTSPESEEKSAPPKPASPPK